MWLKVVPHFFAHEGALLALMAGARVPTMLSHDSGRMLLAEVAGKDLYFAELPLLRDMVNLLVELQRLWSDRVEELLALGLPDWRAPALGAAIAEVVERTRDEVSAEDRATLAHFVRGLPGRFDDVAACGVRDTLVHGDFHPGNFRGDERTLTLLDWGDSGVGHPLLDQPAFLDGVPSGAVGAVRAHWLQLCREAVPGSDPARASVLLAPVAAARRAVVYRTFSTTSSLRNNPIIVPIQRSGWLGRQHSCGRVIERALSSVLAIDEKKFAGSGSGHQQTQSEQNESASRPNSRH
jgi:Phosphotransferase enzyme family